MSDIDARTDKVQRDLLGPAKEAREAQTIADRQRDDATQKDRDRMERAWGYERAEANDPALRPWNADQERANRVRGPMEQFGSVGFIFAMAASAFTRTPMTSALNAGAAAMTAIQQGDEKAYEHAYKAWKDNSDLAIRRFDIEHRLYEDADKLLTTDMTLWKQKTLEIAAQFNDQKKIAMLQNGMDPEVLKSRESLLKSRMEAQKWQQEFETFESQRKMIKEGISALRKEHPDWKDDNKGLEQTAAEAQVYAKAVQASKGILPRELTGPQEFSRKWWEEHPNGTAEEFSTAFGEFMRGQKPSPAASGRVTSSMDQVQRINERTEKYEAQGMSREAAHNKAAHEVQEEDSKARSAGREKIDQSIINELAHYPGMTREDLGTILPTRQPKLIASFESAKNLEAIAAYAKENPESIGLIAEATRRMNLDAYQGLFGSKGEASEKLRAKTEADRDAEIDKVAKERKLDLSQAAKAKVLQKMLTTQSFADAATAGARGGTIYLDKAFREIYQQASSPGAFFSILEKRYDEADRIAREYKMGFDDRDDRDRMPFWQQKAAGYAGTLVDKPPVPGAKKAKDGNWYVPDPKRPGKYLMVRP